MNIENKIGPSVLPAGTPDDIQYCRDVAFPILTKLILFETNSYSHLIVLNPIPKRFILPINKRCMTKKLLCETHDKYILLSVFQFLARLKRWFSFFLISESWVFSSRWKEWFQHLKTINYTLTARLYCSDMNMIFSIDIHSLFIRRRAVNNVLFCPIWDLLNEKMLLWIVFWDPGFLILPILLGFFMKLRTFFFGLHFLRNPKPFLLNFWIFGIF